MAFARAGEHAAASQVAEANVKEPEGDTTNRGYLYNAATSIALASAAASEDESLDESERDNLQEKYAVRAVELVRTLAVVGYFAALDNRHQLDDDTDLNGLRERDDYKEFLRELDAAV